MNINTWDIKNNTLNNQIINKINSELLNEEFKTKLLNINNDKFDILEKFVYDSALFHFTNLNYDLNNGEYFIEFWIKNKFDTHFLHVDCDEHEKKENLNYVYPLLSIVSYFNESDAPTIITNIDMERYKYKKFEDDISFFLSFPTPNKQISFNPIYFHGSTLLNEPENDNRIIIAINLWKQKPNNIEFYNSNLKCEHELFNKNEKLIEIEKNNNVIDIPLSEQHINYDLFDELFYNNHAKLLYPFKNIIAENMKTSEYVCYNIFLSKRIEQEVLLAKLKNKYGDVIDDMNYILENNNIRYNRFLQRFIYKNIYSKDLCNWIIDESEMYAKNNNGWTTKRHDNYPTTDLQVEKITNIFPFILKSFETINSLIKESYGLSENILLDINDLFIVKYEYNNQNYLELHTDGSFITFSILLSNSTDYEGGGTYFDDGLTVKINQGDLLIHNSRVKHSGLPITMGKRYLLVGFINIKLTAI